MKTFIQALSLGLVFGLSTQIVSAQACLGPDNLDGPCCDNQLLTLPPFPDLVMQGSAISWTDCIPNPKAPATITLATPNQVECDHFTSTLNVDNLAGISLATGVVELTYSRTWDEIDPSGMIFQVFRFLVMVELNVTAPGSLGGNIPVTNAFYHGYVDYARGCNMPDFDYALVLHHACDEFQHMPVFSVDPGVYHPTTQFGLVAPDTAAQPFVHGAIVPALSGSLFRGTMRDPSPPGVGICPVRAPVQPASLVPGPTGCVCPFSATLPPRNTSSTLSGLSACGGQFFSLDVTPLLPWRHLISTSMGRWSGLGVYPGPEAALVYEGPLLWQENCGGGVFGPVFADIHYGAATRDGWDRLVAPVPIDQMIDLRSNWSKQLPGPTPLPLVGAIMATPFAGKRHVFSMDLL